MNQSKESRSFEFNEYLQELNELIKKEETIPFIGREKQIQTIEETLLRKYKYNVLLSGLPGVGKTALIKELTRRIVSAEVVPQLRLKKIILFSMQKLFIGSESVEQSLLKLEKIFKSLEKSDQEIILFIDDLQFFPLGARSTLKNSLLLFQNLLKYQIGVHAFPLILAVTPEDEQRLVLSDEFLALNFNTIKLEEPNEEQVIKILRGITPYFENYYQLKIDSKLFAQIYRLARIYLPFRAFPDKAIELLDNACSKTTLQKMPVLQSEMIYESLAILTKLDIAVIKHDPLKKLKDLRAFLDRQIVNQNGAKEEVIRILNLSVLQKKPDSHRPQAIFLFLGPAGCGKSHFALKLAEFLFSSPQKLRQINLASLKKAEDARKLISSDDEPGLLLQEIINHPFSIIFLENINEAHSSVLYNLGKILTRGEIRLGSGKKYFLSTNIIILSLTHIGEAKERAIVGFVQGNRDNREFIVDQKILNILEWTDEIIEFVPFSQQDLMEIAARNMEVFSQEIRRDFSWKLRFKPEVLQKMAGEALESGQFAHQIKTIIEKRFKAAIASLLSIETGKKNLYIEVKNDDYQFRLSAR